MPMIVPFLPLIAGVVTSGMGLIKNFVGGDSGPSSTGLEEQNKMLASQQAQSEEQQRAQQAAAVRRAAPDAQAQTGGALSDASFAQLVASMTGNPGGGTAAQTTLFGANGGGDQSGLYDSMQSLSSPIVSGGDGMPQMSEMGLGA